MRKADKNQNKKAQAYVNIKQKLKTEKKEIETQTIVVGTFEKKIIKKDSKENQTNCRNERSRAIANTAVDCH